MNNRSLFIVKIVAFTLMLVAIVWAGTEFRNHRNFAEPVVLGEGVTTVKKLSDYYPGMKDSINDCNIYIFEGKEPGGTLMVIGGSHPEEPAANLTAELLVETARSRSGTQLWPFGPIAVPPQLPGQGMPTHNTTPSPQHGAKNSTAWEIADQSSDSWPDPEVYVHYPSRQMLAYMDVRNFNRTWPGYPNGTLTERTNYAFMELIRKENVDVFIDLHEAELEYPVISTIVAHQKGTNVAAMTSMMLNATEFRIGMEYSPESLHGLSHSEFGDHSQAVSYLLETPEPLLDRVRGVTDENLLLTGKDPFVQMAGRYGLLYEKIDENGWPIDVRVGRHASTVLELAQSWSDLNMTKPIKISNVPRYGEIIENGIGHYFANPASVPSTRLAYE